MLRQSGAFVNAAVNQEARTENNMKARKGTANSCVDLFYKAGAMRGQNIIPAFVAAYVENEEIALRILQWLRDVRGGAGERQLFRNALQHLATNYQTSARKILHKVPIIGRWDDLFCLIGTPLESAVDDLVRSGLEDKNGLLAKWMPRKGEIAYHFQHAFGWTPKQYRKTIVGLTNVVETKMCANQWDSINYAHVPSLAHARYKKAFGRHGETYVAYLNALVKGEAKINAGALYPYDVLKGWNGFQENQWIAAEAQWAALPNFVGDAPVLSVVDTSGSMECPVGKNPKLRVIDVAMSLGLYTADKNTGPFKDCFVNFAGTPQLNVLRGSIANKLQQMQQYGHDWGSNTNLHAAIELILKTGIDHKVPDAEMPKVLIIFSDMQFDHCVKFDDSANDMIRRKYETAGYTVPRVAFWNLRDAGNVPVKFNAQGVALLSGFSPAVMKSVLGNVELKPENFTPEVAMMETIMVDRYAI